MITSEAKLLDVFHAHRAAEKAYIAAIEEIYPPGSIVSWMHGDHMQHGEVHASKYGQLRVLNSKTGRLVSVSPFSVLMASYNIQEILA